MTNYFLQETSFMADLTIGFIGLGLIGGSIAKTLRRVRPDCRLIAYNRSRQSLVDALSDGTLNSITDSIDASFAECDYVFLCMPVSLNIRCLEKLKDLLPESCLITDAGSVKTSIHEAVIRLGLEDRFIGGHPMAGSEKTGYANATDRLLENAYYIITPTGSSDPEKVEAYRQLAAELGSIPLVIGYEEHDQATAAISHLPHVIAYSLVNYVRESDSPAGLMRQIAAGGFRDITRIASSSPDMWESICLENSRPLLDAIDRYKGILDRIADAVKSENAALLHQDFENAKNYRDDMPTKMSGMIAPAHEIYVDIIDETGAIATLATILGTNAISIKNIGIIHNREFQEGVLRIEFYDAASVTKAAGLLNKFSYTVHMR